MAKTTRKNAVDKDLEEPQVDMPEAPTEPDTDTDTKFEAADAIIDEAVDVNADADNDVEDNVEGDANANEVNDTDVAPEPTEVTTMADKDTKDEMDAKAAPAAPAPAFDMNMFVDALRQAANPGPQSGAVALEGATETIPGGKFLLNGRWVNAEGEAIKVSAEEEKYAEQMRAEMLKARQKNFVAPAELKEPGEL
jgi:hypothetical protein